MLDENDEVPLARRHPLARCEDCGLNTPDSRFCPSEGPPKAEVVVVGEAPGYDEARQGRPFIGPSGRLLNTVLNYHRIDRSAVFVTNTCLCRPKDNRTPTKSEIDCCSSRLRAEITTRDPRIIIALGNTAASSIMGTKVAITSFRVGPPKKSPLYTEAEVIATVHPAYCLRTADAFPLLVNDIGKVNTQVRIKWEEPQWRQYGRAAEGETVLRQLRDRCDDLVVDIETGQEKDSVFEHSDRNELLCVGFSYAAGRAVVLWGDALKDGSCRNLLQQLLETKNIVCQNGKFDLANLRQFGKTKLGFDTMLASYASDERPGVHSLGYQAVELLGAPNWKHVMDKYKDNYAAAPKDVLHKYNALDCANTWLLKDHYQAKFKEQPELGKLHDFLCEASDALMLSEMEGIKVSGDVLDHLTDHYLEGLEGLERDLFKYVNNPRSPMQVKAALLEMGVKVESTDEEHLCAVRDKVSSRTPRGEDILDFVTQMLLHRREQKLYGTYVKGIRKRLWNGRIYPSFLLHGTVTGRLACRNPNLQNVPRESSIRRMYVPEEGNVFIQADYATIELRVIATLARDGYLRDLFNEGRDIHNEVSLRFFGPSFTKDQRVRAKAVVYGLSYGREAYSLAQEYKWSVNEAQKYLNEFFRMIPDTARWRDEIKHKVLTEQEDLISPFGRHRRFWLITNDNKKDVLKEALATLPQSIASDICLSALIRLRRDYGISIRLPVHDSLLAECKAADAAEVSALMKQVMSETATEVFTDYVPFPVDIVTGNSWAEV